jgi:hypothetical protein
MKTLLVILLLAAMVATVVMLVRGVIVMLKTKEAELMAGDGPSMSALQQNKAMRGRIMFQALAILITAMLIALSRSA